MTDYVVAGTGSRSLQVAPVEVKRAAANLTADALAGLVEAHGDRLVVMSGMAEGFDACLAYTALRAGVRLWAAVPNKGFGGHYWGRNSLTGRDRLAEFVGILAAAERVTFVMEEIHGTTRLHLDGVHANFVRNSWMVNGGPDGFAGADEFVVWDPTSRGTAHCLAEIRRAGKPFRVLSEPAEALTLL